MASLLESTLPGGGSGRARALSSGPFLSLVFRSDRPVDDALRFDLGAIDEVHLGRDESRRHRRTTQAGMELLHLGEPDALLSRQHLRLLRVDGRWRVQDLESKNGTRLDGAALREAVALRDGAVIEAGQCFFIFREGGSWQPPPTRAEDGAATLSPGFEELLARVRTIAASTVPVIILGETGTGKEVMAREIHLGSGRQGSFQAINCGALPATLLESELFGYRRGAFSGATEDRPGLIRSAEGGTLFLDEIADLAGPSQAALLRVLQEREVLPLGATRAVKVDVRILCATHRDLEGLVRQGGFRADLLARLAGFTVQLPPLRHRREDIGLLTRALLTRLFPQQAAQLRFSLEAARAMVSYAWPANVRELEKCLLSAVVLAAGQTVDVAHLPSTLTTSGPWDGDAQDSEAAPDAPALLSEEERAMRERLVGLLSASGGNVAEVARLMQKGRTQIHRWIARYQIDVEELRKTTE